MKNRKKDKESDWAKARVVIATQLQDQVLNAELVNQGAIMLEEAMGREYPRPVWRDAVYFFFDENHSQAMIGGNGHGGSSFSIQYQISLDPDTGELLPIEDGGVMPRRKERVEPKYTKEACGCYGVACPFVNGENNKGQFMETWDYTETNLRSHKRYQREAANEMKY
jgi:hypothetical protein